jgi:choline dehydrogenase-like flavoprotein
VKTWLADAHASGARVLVRTQVQRILAGGGTAPRVEAETLDGYRVTVRSRAVVTACGALQTPALLLRSGLRNAHVGRNLRLHPVTAVTAVFEEEIRPWEGTMQALYCGELRDLDAGYGVMLETGAVHPSLPVAFMPWRGSAAHAALMQRLPNVVGIGIILRERDAGGVRVGRNGRPRVRYRLSEYDARHVRTGVDGAAHVLEAAGARQIVSSHASGVSYEPGWRADRAQFMAGADACGYGPGRCAFVSFHHMGSARMGDSPRTSACDPEGRLWEAPDVIVCDGSAFPTASGVNPMLSIAAIAYMNASALAGRLT